MTVRDTRMMARALTDRWVISSDRRAELVAEMERIVLSGAANYREKTAAFNALVAATKDSEAQSASTDEQRNRFLAIAERLGIVPSDQPALTVRAAESDHAAAQDDIDRAE